MNVTKGQVAELRGALHYAKMIEALIVGTTIDDAAECSGLHVKTIRRYIAAFRHARDPEKPGWRMCRVVDYRLNDAGRRTVKVYRLEWGYDKRQPRMTDAEKSRRYRERRSKPRAAETRLLAAIGVSMGSTNDLRHSENDATVSTIG